MDNATHDHHDSSSYRIPIALRFFWSIILVRAASRDSVASPKITKPFRELAEIQANHRYEASLGESGYIDCFRGDLLKWLAPVCFLQGL
ncbi:Plasma membrane low glucose sensor [Penicillium rubens]|nr:Plasma membrane low glucose sensor [Penicillium rubens]